MLQKYPAWCLGVLAAHSPSSCTYCATHRASGLPGHRSDCLQGNKKELNKVDKELGKLRLRAFGTFMVVLWLGVSGLKLENDTLTHLSEPLSRGH